MAYHQRRWSYYVWHPDEPVFAGAELPTNEFLAVGRTLIQLAAATGDRDYVDRAAALAGTLRGQLRLTGDTFDWPYWPSFGRVHHGWTKTGDPVDDDGSWYRPQFRAVTKAEDVTHALIDIDFVVLYRSTPDCPRSSPTPTCGSWPAPSSGTSTYAESVGGRQSGVTSAAAVGPVRLSMRRRL